ncbi:hypothetical protein ACA910_012844 [Epithemia clementina (nom. ined.)]
MPKQMVAFMGGGVAKISQQQHQIPIVTPFSNLILCSPGSKVSIYAAGGNTIQWLGGDSVVCPGASVGDISATSPSSILEVTEDSFGFLLGDLPIAQQHVPVPNAALSTEKL